MRRPTRLLAIGGLLVALIAGAALALFLQGRGDSATAFADAPSGSYVVVARRTGDAHVVTVLGAPPSDLAIEVATVPHLPGFSLRGSVSPNGRFLALIVPEGGTAARPIAALISVDLESGAVTRLAEGIDVLQDPIWAPASDAVVVTRSTASSGGGSDVAVLRSALAGGEEELGRHANVLAAAPVGFDTAGALVAVVLDARGSTLTVGGAERGRVSPHLTRDWALSPDGRQLAYVEANLDGGLRYLPQLVSISGGGVTAAAASTGGEAQVLGVAWDPAGGSARFGIEPSTTGGNVTAQGAGGGFDVPLAYSRNGGFLAVQHWDGSSFDSPGRARLEIISEGGRRPLAGYTRFFGWAAR